MASTKKNILWLADPWHTLDHANDSTLHLINHFQATHYWATGKELFLVQNTVFIKTDGIVRNSELVRKEKIFPIHDFESIHWRADPPVTYQTFFQWNLLLTATSDTKIFNSPEGLLKWNEKLSSLAFSWSVPSSLFQSSNDAIAFIQRQKDEKHFVVKNLFDAASRGVRLVQRNSPNLKSEIDSIYLPSMSPLIIQRYQNKIEELGETRIFIINGKPCGALNKKPVKRGIMSLDSAQKPLLSLCTPSAKQQSRSKLIAARLKKDGIHLACIDFIGDQILEINVTSTGLIKWFDSQVDEKKKLAYMYWKNQR